MPSDLRFLFYNVINEYTFVIYERVLHTSIHENQATKRVNFPFIFD